MQAEFARWDDIDVHYRGEVITSGGHGFAAMGRKRLLQILQERCRELGVDVRFRCEADTLRPGESDERSIAEIRRIFADVLDGHQVLANNSKWIRFGTIRTERWSDGKVVLLGDAAHTAHFSIGSGTKLAMEDALALAA